MSAELTKDVRDPARGETVQAIGRLVGLSLNLLQPLAPSNAVLVGWYHPEAGPDASPLEIESFRPGTRGIPGIDRIREELGDHWNATAEYLAGAVAVAQSPGGDT